jgi:hypothetical protein
MENKMEEEGSSKLVWNFDDAEAKLIFNFKEKFIYYRDEWDLEKSYWILLSFLSEVETLFDDAKKQELNKSFDDITALRDEAPNFNNTEDGVKVALFNKLNKFYRDLCFEIVEKDFYFRKKKEYLGL